VINFHEFNQLNEEVGEKTSTSYSFYKSMDSDLLTSFKFTTEDNDLYIVGFYNLGNIQKTKSYQDCYDVYFILKDKDEFVIVNKGRIFKVISTVIDIIKMFIEIKNPKKINISPSKNYKGDKRRKNIYLRYIEKYIMDDYRIKKYMFSNNISIIKK
jgi:hypothetical protein